MLVVRDINNIKIAIETTEACGVLFKSEDIKKYDINKAGCDFKKILKILKGDCEMLPLDMVWELTNRCNLNCPFCYIHNVQNGIDVTFEKAKPVIDDAISMGLLHVILTGGECTLNKDFLKIYKYLKENGVLVDVYTNGVDISEDVYETFEKLPPNKVEITIYNKEDKRPYNTCLRLKKMKVNLLVKFTVTTTTVSDFDYVSLWCKENGLDFQFDADIFDGLNYNKPSKYMVNENKKLELDKLKYGNYVPTSTKKITCFECGAGNISAHINANFELACCSKSNERYSLQDSSFEKEYSKMKNAILKVKGNDIVNCKGCIAREFCRMCSVKAQKNILPDGNVEYVVDRNFCKDAMYKYHKLFG